MIISFTRKVHRLQCTRGKMACDQLNIRLKKWLVSRHSVPLFLKVHLTRLYGILTRELTNPFASREFSDPLNYFIHNLHKIVLIPSSSLRRSYVNIFSRLYNFQTQSKGRSNGLHLLKLIVKNRSEKL